MTLKTKFGNARKNNKGYYQISSRKEGNHGKQLHRLIYEDYYNITILSFVDVHHINGLKTDNHIDNLKLMYSSEHRKMHNIGENNHNYGKKLSEEHKKKISDKVKGENHPLYGKHHSDETKKKISEAHKGKIISLDVREKISEAHKGKKISEEQRKKMSKRMKGENNPMYCKHHSEETRQKLSKLFSGKNNPRWGKSIIDEWGGMWFLKTMKEQVKYKKIVSEYTGIKEKTISAYLYNRKTNWTTL